MSPALDTVKLTQHRFVLPCYLNLFKTLFVDHKATCSTQITSFTGHGSFKDLLKANGATPSEQLQGGTTPIWSHFRDRVALKKTKHVFVLYFFDFLWLWWIFDAQTKSAGNKKWHRHGIVRLQSSRSRTHGFPKYISQCLGHDPWLHRPVTLCWWNWWIFARKMFQISCSRGHMHGETGSRKSGAALPYASLKEEPTRQRFYIKPHRLTRFYFQTVQEFHQQ